jgi:hypothetical protein
VQAPVQATQPLVVQGAQPMMVQGAQPMVMPQAQPQVMLPPGAVPQGPLPAGVVPYDPNNPMMAGTPWNTYQQGVAPVYVDGANPCDGMQCPPYAMQQCRLPSALSGPRALIQVCQPEPLRCASGVKPFGSIRPGVDMARPAAKTASGGLAPCLW